VVATIATLFFVPVVFSLLHRRATVLSKTPSDVTPEIGGMNPAPAGA
jgi:UDP-N-acetylmuramyl pentapeptide phosphotransferase/UDP-N-acetylglucosamine-1-phosphate transferase